ncbi:MAG: hypothetical protein IPJ34_43275 [Myxococcales bacterium]|nr:hypothetical protein [Myxococcales bacterium]
MSEASTKEVTLKITPTEGAASSKPSPASAEAKPVWPWVTLGVGAVGLVAGGIFVLQAADKNSAIDDTCPNANCGGDQTKKDKVDALKSSRANLWLGAGLLGGVGLAAGVVGIWGLTRSPTNTAGVHLLVGIGSATVRVVF